MTARHLSSVLAGLVLMALALPGSALADKRLESMFQDDNQLIFNTPEGTVKAMDTLQQLGVDRVRVSVFWKTVAPDGESPTKPAFDAADPAAYPPGSWDRYDQIVRLARARNIAVNFNVTSPAPNWATGNAPRADIDKTFDPNAAEFGLFMRALGVRYSGSYVAGGALLPRVRFWSIWNEPNQPGWLTPQWAKDPRGSKAMVETAPTIYRGLVDASWNALQATAHGDDTILVGETAPKGQKDAKGTTRAIPALRFIRQLYCLDDNLQFYKGTSAELRGCPVGANAIDTFAAQHPGLFKSSGYAHHPYELLFSPHTRPEFKDYATIANLDSLGRTLRRIRQRFRQPVSGSSFSVPLYLTEFGYQTDPPDPSGVSLTKQAAWNSEAEYRAWKNKNVRTLNQFLLVDDKPIEAPTPLQAYGSSFQTGLMTLQGKKKPSFRAYGFPVYLPKRTADSKRRLEVWGIPRIAPENVKHSVRVQARGKLGTPFKTVGTLRTDGDRGYVDGRVTVRRSGALRLSWKDAAGKTWVSRAVAFSVAKR
jgi:hypothetical protein